MANQTMVVMVAWDRQGMPTVTTVTPEEPVQDVMHALALAQVVMGQNVVRRLGESLSETARLQAALEASVHTDEPAEP